MPTGAETVSTALKDEKVNICAMTLGISRKENPHQIMLCKKEPLADVPYLLCPKNSEPEYEFSALGRQYSQEIRTIPFQFRFIGKVDRQIKFNIRESIFDGLCGQGYFDLWPASEPMAYFRTGKSRTPMRFGYIALFRVFETVRAVPDTVVRDSHGWKLRQPLFELSKPVPVELARPVIPDEEFESIVSDITRIVGSAAIDIIR